MTAVAKAPELGEAQDTPYEAPQVPLPAGIPPAGCPSSGAKSSGSGDSELALRALLSRFLPDEARRHHGASLAPSSALRPDIERPG